MCEEEKEQVTELIQYVQHADDSVKGHLCKTQERPPLRIVQECCTGREHCGEDERVPDVHKLLFMINSRKSSAIEALKEY